MKSTSIKSLEGEAQSRKILHRSLHISLVDVPVGFSAVAGFSVVVACFPAASGVHDSAGVPAVAGNPVGTRTPLC